LPAPGTPVQIAANGFNGRSNYLTCCSAATAIFHNQLYFGVDNFNAGASAWSMLFVNYLPLIKR
jgi:hypothetical protein